MNITFYKLDELIFDVFRISTNKLSDTYVLINYIYQLPIYHWFNLSTQDLIENNVLVDCIDDSQRVFYKYNGLSIVCVFGSVTVILKLIIHHTFVKSYINT